jgi:hypothetical protein
MRVGIIADTLRTGRGIVPRTATFGKSMHILAPALGPFLLVKKNPPVKAGSAILAI